MNEEALKYSFELFKKDGYSGDYEQYKQLISSDSEALKYSHQLFSKDGYSGNINDFTDLVGVKKKTLRKLALRKPNLQVAQSLPHLQLSHSLVL